MILLRRWNDWLALQLTNSVGTMWCFYLFCGLACISLPAAYRSHDVIVIVGWVAQTFVQLVLLPAILVGQKIHGAHQEVLDNEMHAAVMALLRKLDPEDDEVIEHGAHRS